nr:BTAD domain-containing putative transcriptional regulator [Pseudonocardia acidicola]
MRFALAGPVQAWYRDEPIRLGPPQRRAVLAALLLDAGRVITPDALVDGIWGADPPARPQAAVQVHISVLRRVLEPGRAARQESRVLRSVGRGYLLDVVGIEVDLFLFRHRVAAARAARAQGWDERAATLLRTALEHWDGVALTGLPGPTAELHRVALLEERLTAFEELVEIELERDSDAVPTVELMRLLQDHPHRERLYSLRMRVLQQQGRRGEALAVYTELRSRLVTDLGIEPGPELRRRQRQILAEEATPAAGLPVVPAADPAPNWPSYPGPAPWLVGRDEVVEQVAAALTPGASRPVLVHGVVGVGTTAVALAAVDRVAQRFPGGVRVLSERSGPPGPPPACALLVVDGVHDESVLAARLGVAPDRVVDALRGPVRRGTTVLIVGSNRLRRLTDLLRAEVRPLTEDESWALLAAGLGDERLEREPTVVRELVRRVGGLAAMLVRHAQHLGPRPDWLLTDYYQDLLEQEAADPDWLIDLALEPVVGHAFAPLDATARTVLCVAALLGEREFSRAEVVATGAVSSRQAIRCLEELVDRNVVDSPRPGRYRFHPLLREYGVALASRSGVRPWPVRAFPGGPNVMGCPTAECEGREAG